jgi:PIN domain nuclease of toxin-antitoxin system
LRFLLDTHIWLWTLLEPQRLTTRVRRALRSQDNELWLSPISTWELLTLVRKGRVELDSDPDKWLDQAMECAPMHEATLTHEIARVSNSIGLEHDDPADRFLAATAKVLELTLVTADRRLIGSKQYRTLANL